MLALRSLLPNQATYPPGQNSMRVCLLWRDMGIKTVATSPPRPLVEDLYQPESQAGCNSTWYECQPSHDTTPVSHKGPLEAKTAHATRRHSPHDRGGSPGLGKISQHCCRPIQRQRGVIPTQPIPFPPMMDGVRARFVRSQTCHMTLD